MCLAQFPLASWAQAESVWGNPLQRCWVFESDEMTSLKIASDNDKTVILPLSNGNLFGIDLDKGKNIWKFSVGESFDSEISVNKQNLFVTGSKIAVKPQTNSASHTSRSLFSIDSNSGIARLVFPDQTASDSEKVFVVSDENLLMIVQEDGNIFSVDKDTRKILWQRKLALEIITAPKLSKSKIYLGTSNRSVVVLSTESGKILSQIPVGKMPKQILSFENDLYIGDELGNLRAIELKTQNTVWQTKTGGEISEIVPFEDVLLVSSNDNYEYAILKKSGKKVWKRKLAGRILGKTIIDGKFAALFTHGSNTALVIDLEGGKIVNRINLAKGNYFVSAPIFLKGKLLAPTKIGLIAYSPNNCAPKP